LNTPFKYLLSELTDKENLLNEIRKNYTLSRDNSHLARMSFLDTFDWRLHSSSLALLKHSKGYELHNLETDSLIRSFHCKPSKKARFWWDFPSEEMKNTLKEYLDQRALMPLGTIERETHSFRILNSNSKTVLRICFEKISLLDEEKKIPASNRLILTPLKGYERYCRKISAILSELNIRQDPDPRPALSIILSISGKNPSLFSSKINVKLTPEATARTAAVEILKALCENIKQNENGLFADIDSEFLHDFRVSTRRTRSALSRIKNVFPQDKVDYFRDKFASLGKITNKARDIDVYLCKREEYLSILPEKLRLPMEKYFDRLQAQRKREYKKLLRELHSSHYRKFIAEWEAFLNRKKSFGKAANSETPALEIASKFIRGRLKKILLSGKAISSTTPDCELHALRIECKKLRYLMEFFSSLFPEEEIETLTSQMKKLQDNLGSFNDLRIQQETLELSITKISPENPELRLLTAAIGGLVTHIYNEKLKVRADFDEAFKRFADRKNLALFDKLFGQP